MIYVLSDIHGNKENFDTILEKIDLRMEDFLYVIGDVVDRHPYGIQLLQQIMGMPNARMLPGNHEWMMMKALGISHPMLKTKEEGGSIVYEAMMRKMLARRAEKERFALWYGNGGDVTHKAWKGLSDDERKELGNFLSSLPLSYDVNVNGKDYKLVHAAPTELYRKFSGAEYENEAEFAVWDREMFKYRFPFGAAIIFGHTPTLYMQDNNPLEIWDAGDMVGIDCGSGIQELSGLYSVKGRLACLRLDDGEVFYSK
mgnify:CR=1 FL=1